MTLPDRIDGAALHSVGQQAVVTPHYLASRAAMNVLAAGGNAVDAAIAANSTLGVVAPETCGIGGDLFALVHEPGRSKPAALNSSGRAGSGGRAEAIRGLGLDEIPIESPHAVTVPGCVEGWTSLHEQFGSMPLTDILEPAIEQATDGFPASPELAGALRRLESRLRPQPAATGLYPEATAPVAGDRLTRPTLARTLAAIAQEGRDAFYRGPVAAAIVDATESALSLADVAAHRADWVEPISATVMGWTGWTIPPNSQGYLTLAAGWLFEHLQPPHDPETPAFTHAAIEAYRAVGWERDDYVSDAAFSPIPAADLLDTDRLEDRLANIDMSIRNQWPAPRRAPGGTAYLCVRDRSDMGVSLIQSNFHGIGSRIGAGDAGFFLHDRGSGFNLIPGHANEIQPGKRPLHTLSPTLWTESGELRMLLGTRGGAFQPQTLLQMLAYVRWAGLDPVTAQLLPRWATSEWRGAGKATVFVEPHLDKSVQTALAAKGHEVERAPGWVPGWGPVSVITGSGDAVTGDADPRVATSAAYSSPQECAEHRRTDSQAR